MAGRERRPLWIVALVPLLVAAQEPQDDGRRQLFRSEVGMTRIKAAVIDGEGNPIEGLGPRDFRVRENGTDQEVAMVLDPVRYSLDVAMVLDFSFSIERDWSGRAARRAAHGFLDRLAPGDCVFLLPFHQTVGPGIWGHPDDARLRGAIDRYQFDNMTRLYDALLTAHDALDGRRPDSASAAAEELEDTLYTTWMEPVEDASCGEPLSPDEALERRAALVVLTDGEDLGSNAEYADVLLASWRSEVPIFAVAVGNAAASTARLANSWTQARPLWSTPNSRRLTRQALENLRMLRDQLAELARVSGGQLVLQQDLSDGYEATLGLLRSYYVIVYPSPSPLTEGWHELDVDLVGRRGDVIVQPGVYRTGGSHVAAVGALRAADVALQLEQLDTALEQYDWAATMTPDVGAPFFGRGLVLERMERWQEARDSYERSLQLRPGAAMTHARIAAVSLMLGDNASSWEHAIRALKGGVDSSELLSDLEKLERFPADLQPLLDGPVVHVSRPRVPELESQIRLREVTRLMIDAIDRHAAMAVGSAPPRSHFVVNTWVRRLKDDGELTARLIVVDTESGDQKTLGFEVDDVNDADQRSRATRRVLAEAFEWIRERHAAR